MAFIRFSQELEKQGSQCLLEHARFGYTAFAARKEAALSDRIYAVSEDTLDELQEEGINYLPLKEGELKELLSEQGLRNFEFMRNTQPENVYFNAKLPPMLHLEASFLLSSRDRYAVQLLLGEYPVENVRFSHLVGDHFANADAGAAEELLRVSFWIPKKHFADLHQTLAKEKLAGFSQESKIIISSDPDGPPSK